MDDGETREYVNYDLQISSKIRKSYPSRCMLPCYSPTGTPAPVTVIEFIGLCFVVRVLLDSEIVRVTLLNTGCVGGIHLMLSSPLTPPGWRCRRTVKRPGIRRVFGRHLGVSSVCTDTSGSRPRWRIHFSCGRRFEDEGGHFRTDS